MCFAHCGHHRSQAQGQRQEDEAAAVGGDEQEAHSFGGTGVSPVHKG
jgi:hypothetical protein